MIFTSVTTHCRSLKVSSNRLASLCTLHQTVWPIRTNLSTVPSSVNGVLFEPSSGRMQSSLIMSVLMKRCLLLSNFYSLADQFPLLTMSLRLSFFFLCCPCWWTLTIIRSDLFDWSTYSIFLFQLQSNKILYELLPIFFFIVRAILF